MDMWSRRTLGCTSCTPRTPGARVYLMYPACTPPGYMRSMYLMYPACVAYFGRGRGRGSWLRSRGRCVDASCAASCAGASAVKCHARRRPIRAKLIEQVALEHRLGGLALAVACRVVVHVDRGFFCRRPRLPRRLVELMRRRTDCARRLMDMREPLLHRCCLAPAGGADVLQLLLAVESLLSVLAGVRHAARRHCRRAALCMKLLLTQSYLDRSASLRHAHGWWCLQWLCWFIIVGVGALVLQLSPKIFVHP